MLLLSVLFIWHLLVTAKSPTPAGIREAWNVKGPRVWPARRENVCARVYAYGRTDSNFHGTRLPRSGWK
jgi:hypothetical protein